MQNAILLIVVFMSIVLASCRQEEKGTGTQVWDLANLNVSTFSNGDPIQEAASWEEWAKAGERGQPAWCYFEENTSNGMKYGKLYNGYAVIDPRGLCPTGWHIPTEVEWTTLINYLGGDSVAGRKLKSTFDWRENGNGTNLSGFKALPGGGRNPNGDFHVANSIGHWWGSDENDEGQLVSCEVLFFNSWAQVGGRPDYADGYSVRCLKGNGPSGTNRITSSKIIGTQEWMLRNLNVYTFQNGNLIHQAKSEEDWYEAYAYGKPAWCYYENDPKNGQKYGKLYNWHAVKDPRGLCPTGWHVPSDAEWTLLIDYLGGEEVAGIKMKSTSGWDENGNGNNSSGFAGRPSGGRFNYEGMIFMEGAEWWSSTESGKYDHTALTFGLNFNSTVKNHSDKVNGLSVRCLKN